VSVLLAGCGSDSKPAPAPVAAKPAPKIYDEWRRFPKENLVDTKVVQKELVGKSFMPGGTLAHYKKGKVEFEMFLAEFPTPDDAAIATLDWKKALTDSKLVPSFGGCFGTDAGRGVFIFPKGKWLGGVVGLPEKDADLLSRTLAGQIQ
jgi:hypothetical protein